MEPYFIRVYGEGKSPRNVLPLEVTFEEAYERFAAIPGLFIELDGSWVWRDPLAGWQLDGNLLDGGLALYCVEFKGNAPRFVLERLLGLLAISSHSFTVESVTEGTMIPVEAFLRSLD